MRLFITLLVVLLSLSQQAYAQIQYQPNVTIIEISAYDDYLDGAVFLNLSTNYEACQKGAYLKANSKGFNSLYTLAVTAATTKANVTLQLYDDRIKSERCEVDAIRLFFD